VQHGVGNKQVKRTRIGPAALTAPHASNAPHRLHSLHFCRYHTAHILQFNAIVGHVAISNSVMNNVSAFVSTGGSARPAPAETNLETIAFAKHGPQISHTTYDTFPVSKFQRRNWYRTPLSQPAAASMLSYALQLNRRLDCNGDKLERRWSSMTYSGTWRHLTVTCHVVSLKYTRKIAGNITE
jgi:hypothetical protein